MDIFLLYLWTRLDDFLWLFQSGFVIGLISISITGAAFIITASTEGLEDELPIAWKKLLIKAVKYTAALMVVAAFFPSQKDAAIIAGGWAVKQVATSEGAQQISSKTFALINGKLDEELAKLTTKEEK